MTLFHERWRVRVSMLAAGALSPHEEAAVQAHLRGCDACRADFERSLRALDVLGRDPARSAEMPLSIESLKTRVRARLDEAPPSRSFRWGLAGAGLAAAALAVAILPTLLRRAHPPEPAVAVTEKLVPDEVMARMERRLARDSAARYLDEAQDVLVTVSAHPADCEDERGRIDVGQEARRSRELLEKRALMVELGGDEVASAQPLLDDVEGLLREVAALPACVRADSLEAIHKQMERRNVLMKIDLMTQELRGVKRLAAVLLLLLSSAGAASAQTDAERVRAAKALTLDRKYAEARTAWTAILADAQGADADAAAYWIARSSEKLGEHERAFKEYGTFLARRPADRSLLDEARTSRISLAARLYRAGQTSYVNVMHEGLTDANKTVRYFAALQLGGLGAPTSARAVPALQEILARETDEDLLDRARIILMKLDPKALSRTPAPSRVEPPPAAGPPVAARWLRVRVFERGHSEPEVSVNVPVALADVLFESLPDEAKGELKKKGYDADNFWRKLKQLGPSEIVEIKGDDGSVVKVWLE